MLCSVEYRQLCCLEGNWGERAACSACLHQPLQASTIPELAFLVGPLESYSIYPGLPVSLQWLPSNLILSLPAQLHLLGLMPSAKS